MMTSPPQPDGCSQGQMESKARYINVFTKYHVHVKTT
jgi:hypothetical protein